MGRHGLHHVTTIAGPAASALRMHTRVFGLRLVKRTVNFDDPTTWHLYYGDRDGAPGTMLTVFPWAHAAAALAGCGEASEVAFRVPPGALAGWQLRLVDAGLAPGAPSARFGERRVAVRDGDGLRLALVEQAVARPDATAIDGLHGVTLAVSDPARTGAVLTDVLGFGAAVVDGAHHRFRTDAAGPDVPGTVVDLVAAPESPPARLGRGALHHVAFRAAADAEQADVADRLRREHRLRVTAPQDRRYFRSVYFREPGGVLFEIATEGPGFAADEAPDALGRSLRLPPALEARRTVIERTLPPLEP